MNMRLPLPLLAAMLLFGGISAPSRADILYLPLGNGVIEKITSAGSGSVFVSSGLNNPIGLAFDSVGNLYVANNIDTMEKFSSTGTDLGLFANSTNGFNNSPGFLAFTNDAGVPLPLPGQAPEPATCALLLLGGIGMLAARRPRAAARTS